MRVLVVGDVVGSAGRRALQAVLPALRAELRLDLVVANGENSAGGFGITPETADALLSSGVDVITSGNHIWNRREILPLMDDGMPIVRPLNYPPGAPGRGHTRVGTVVVVNLIGRVFMGAFDCPFRAMDSLLASLDAEPATVIVDFHAEATSEKAALAWYLDGRVAAVVGTHTHVPTADARLLPKGTAFVSDVGMVGPVNSVIGTAPSDAIARFLYQMPQRLNVAAGGPVQFNSVLVEVDQATGRAVGITRVDRETGR